MQRKIVPHVINKQDLQTVLLTDTVKEAAVKMTKKNISAILVVDKDDATKLIGLMSSNDLTQRVVAEEIDPKETPVGDVMTTDVISIAPNYTARDALNIMRDHRCRHLPVVDNGTLVGIVSIRDLYATLDLDLQDEIIETRNYINGAGGYSRS